jgi:hypothetical protein
VAAILRAKEVAVNLTSACDRPRGASRFHDVATGRFHGGPHRAAAVPGAQRLIDFDVERVIEIAGGIPQRWSFGSYSRFNPV